MADEKTEKRFTPDEVIARQRNRQLLIVTAVIAVLALLVFITRTTTVDESPIQTLPLVGGTLEEPAFAEDDITLVEMWTGKGEKLVLKKEGQSWRVPSRFNITADDRGVSSLLTRISDSRRLNRPITTQAESLVLYRLDDESSTHLRLAGKDGELLHLLVGRPETGTRTFVRIVGQDAPEGIFEVTSVAGQFGSLYDQLNLTPEGEPDAKRWLDFKAFRPLPFTAVAHRIKLRDGARELDFARTAGSDPAADDWEMVAPRKARANGANVRSIVDALMNFSATDIAGPVQTVGAQLGVVEAAKELTVEYSDDGKMATSRLYFGKQEDGKVAVQLKSEGVGEFVYWCPDYALTRLFRPTGDFLEKKGVKPFPDGASAKRLTLSDTGKVVTLERDEDAWKLVEPFSGRASQTLVNGLVTSLTAVQGYAVDAAALDRAELKLGKGISERWIEAGYKPAEKPSDQDGDGAQDSPEGEPAPPPEATPTPAPEPEPPALKTVTLYFGITVDREVPVLRVVEGEADQVYWVAETRVLELFPGPRDLQDTENVGALRIDDKPAEIIVRDGETTLITLTKPDAEWQIEGETPVKADGKFVEDLLRSLRGFIGVREPEPDLEAHSPDRARRSIQVKLGTGDDAPRVTFSFGAAEHGFIPVLSQRAADTKLHWVNQSQVESVFADPADFQVLEPFKARVRQILISWTGKNDAVKPKEPRTREQAMELVNRIIDEARGSADFIELQRKHNEDSQSENVYDASETAQFVKPFNRLASQLKVGEVGWAETMYGFHILKRIE